MFFMYTQMAVSWYCYDESPVVNWVPANHDWLDSHTYVIVTSNDVVPVAIGPMSVADLWETYGGPHVSEDWEDQDWEPAHPNKRYHCNRYKGDCTLQLESVSPRLQHCLSGGQDTSNHRGHFIHKRSPT